MSESTVKLKEFFEARNLTIEKLKEILNYVEKTSSLANNVEVAGSWASAFGIAVKYIGYGLSYYNYEAGDTVSNVGEWVSFGGTVAKIGSNGGRSLVSLFYLKAAENAIKHDAELLEKLKSSLKKLETTRETAKNEEYWILVREGANVLKIASPYLIAKAFPGLIPPKNGKWAKGFMILGDLGSLFIDWNTIVKLNRESSKSHFSQYLEGLIQHLEWQQEKIGAILYGQ